MIINETESNVQKVGNFSTSGFKIAASAKAFQILSSNIYTHKVRAVIREISCNAYDAHVAAKNPNPFSVHLPTYLEPWFSVRDYGIGLSEDDVRNLYTTYFTSTKTESNEYIGALGLGSKSPFCLVDSFSVTSFFNGEKKVYTCFKDNSGEPQVALLTSELSDEPNGLEVLVPGLEGRRDEFNSEAVEVFSYFDKMPEINNSGVIESISHLRTRYVLQGDGFAFTQSYGTPKAVMGNVAYDIPYNYIGDLGMTGYVRFAIGDLNFDPGREKLSLDDKTVAKLKERLAEVSDSISEQSLKLVESQPTAWTKAVKVQDLMRGPLGRHLRDSSTEIVKKIRAYDIPRLDNPATVISPRSKGVDRVTTYILDLSTSEQSFFINKPRMERRVKHYVKENQETVVLLTEEQAQQLQIDADCLKDIDTIPKIPYKTSRTGSGKPSVCVTIYGSSEDVTELPSGEKVYLPICRNKIDAVGAGWRFSDSYIFETMRLVRQFAEFGELYVIKSAHLETKRFQKQKNAGEWIRFDDFVRRELRKTYGTKIRRFDESNYDLPSILESAETGLELNYPESLALVQIKNFNRAYKEYISEGPIHDLMKHVLNDCEEDTSLNAEMKALVDKYPLLDFVRLSYQKVENFQKAIADYMESVDKAVA